MVSGSVFHGSTEPGNTVTECLHLGFRILRLYGTSDEGIVVDDNLHHLGNFGIHKLTESFSWRICGLETP